MRLWGGHCVVGEAVARWPWRRIPFLFTPLAILSINSFSFFVAVPFDLIFHFLSLFPFSFSFLISLFLFSLLFFFFILESFLVDVIDETTEKRMRAERIVVDRSKRKINESILNLFLIQKKKYR